MKTQFDGHIIIFGCGAVAQCFLPLIIRHIGMNHAHITVIGPEENQKITRLLSEHKASFIHTLVTKENYLALLARYVKSGDIIIDLAVNIETKAIINWCQVHNVRYINTSVEFWPEDLEKTVDIRDKTLYVRHMELMEYANKQWRKNGPTSIVEHGANPGLVSHWTKQALITIAQKIVEKKKNNNEKKELEKALSDKNFPKLAQLTGTKVIHISERDTQLTNVPKKVNEFVNTWSIPGLQEEGLAPVEMGWGTHERTLPHNAAAHKIGPKNQICLAQIGMNTWAHSWIPAGEIIGMIIRHGEAFSISNYLTVWDNSKAIYRPTVHYVYLPSDSTCSSLHELRMRNFHMQKNSRVLYDEIIHGADELGVLLLGHELNGWWIGSRLTIEQTRTLIGPGQNATTLQVAASVLAATIYVINNPNKGFCEPDDLPHEEVLAVANPYLGECLSVHTDWNPLKNRVDPLGLYKKPEIKNNDDLWQFDNFLVKP